MWWLLGHRGKLGLSAIETVALGFILKNSTVQIHLRMYSLFCFVPYVSNGFIGFFFISSNISDIMGLMCHLWFIRMNIKINKR